jgi:glutamate synthase domain-containing protein 3
MVELFPVEQEEDKQIIKKLIENHFSYTKSKVAQDILSDIDSFYSKFVKVFPVDYRRVLEEESNKIENSPVALI